MRLVFANSSLCIAHTMAVLQVYEFTDTAIMVLKKNNRQITLLHVYHHASTFFPCWWSAVNFAPGGDVWFLCALNSSVHVAMCATHWVKLQISSLAPEGRCCPNHTHNQVRSRYVCMLS